VHVDARTPPGTGAVEIEVENPDGLRAKAAALFTYVGDPTKQPFLRGDGNSDGRIDIADAVATLAYLFAVGQITCLDAGDFNDDGSFNIADAIATLGFMFAQGSPPPAPFGACGPDATDTDGLDCLAFPHCASP
jgi:hypothetical protein